MRAPLAERAEDAAGAPVVLDGPARRTLGQLDGSSSVRFTQATAGTPDRTTCSWLVRAPAGSLVSVSVSHARAGATSIQILLDPVQSNR